MVNKEKFIINIFIFINKHNTDVSVKNNYVCINRNI